MKIKIIILTLLVLIGSVAHAHTFTGTVGSATITAQGAFSLNAGDVLTLTAQVVSCGQGQLPLYQGSPISLTPNQTPAAPFTANAGQTVTFTVPGNDQIICGGQAYTLYAITWLDNGFPIAPTQTYRFIDAMTVNLNQLIPINFIPPVIGNAAGALCPALTPIFTGFTANYQIQCAANAPNSTAALPISGGILGGSFAVPSPFVSTLYQITNTLFNGLPMADQFVGSDFCAKLRTAEVYALAHNVGTVDATHFSNTQSCTTDPFQNLAAGGVTGTVNLEILLPASVISFTTPIQVNDTGIKIRGAGRGNTIWLYTGSTTNTNLFVIGGDAVNFTQFVEVHDMSVVDSHASGSTNSDIEVFNSHRDILENLSAWGGSTCFVTAGAVTDTLSNLHCSNEDAANFGWASYQTPATGIFLTSQGVDDTTDGTVRDFSAEFVSGIGIHIVAADNMVFTAGTSEGNNKGIVVDTNAGHNKWNNFIGMDIEGNFANVTGVDVTDDGQSNYYINGLYSSPCTGGCAATLLAGGGGGQTILGDGPLHGWTGTWNVLNNNPDYSQNGGVFHMNVAAVTTVNATQVNPQQVIVAGGLALLSAPILTSTGGLPTCTPGTGITTCVVAAGSTQSRGFITITNSTATTGQVLGTLNFAATLASVPFCSLTQSGGTTFLGLVNNSPTNAHFSISNTQTVSGVTTIQLGYNCEL